jgi:hypothetical protein
MVEKGDGSRFQRIIPWLVAGVLRRRSSVCPIFNVLHLPFLANEDWPPKMPTYQPGHFIVIISYIK